MGRYRETFTATFILLISLFYFGYALFCIEIKTLNGVPSSAFIPRVVGFFMVILSLALFIISIKSDRIHVDQTQNGVNDKELFNVMVSALFLLGYIVALQPIGFLITTAGYLFLQISFMANPATSKQPKVLLKHGIIALVTTMVIEYLFVDVFVLILPSGILG